VVQSKDESTSRHSNSKCCYNRSICTDPALGKGCVITEAFSEGMPFPLSSKCCGAKEVHCKDGPKVVAFLLLLSGDVETNPGPGNIFTGSTFTRGRVVTMRGWLQCMGQG
jgi:hypothetical protein